MSLLASLIYRVIGAVTLSLLCAAAWVMIDANRNIRAEVTASADRVAQQAAGLAWREMTFRGSVGADAKFAFPDWRSSDTLRVISPGYCVSLAWTGEAPLRLCGGPANVGASAPTWFMAFYRAIFGPTEAETRNIHVFKQTAGVVVAEADEGAAARHAWRQVSVVVGVAAAMAVGISLLATLAIGHALRPADVIVAGLKRLEAGDLGARLPAFRTREFDLIARAFNDLTQRLSHTTAQRAALTRRLFQVQEDERRSLARDLHDEFGQCLTATRALAAAIMAASETERPDVADEAREIGSISERMMATLRSTLSRLRPPELDEVGLERSLDHLVASWNARLAAPAGQSAPPVFRLDIVGGLAAVPNQAALTIYRVAQECLTNAARHGAPTEVRVKVERAAGADNAVALTVEDDGGGDPASLTDRAGHGILGIRERIEALGGRLTTGPAAHGVRIAAIIPLYGLEPAGAGGANA
ncbi:MAG TPA: histidine kinase [Hansschlegelia sp.]